MSGVETSDDEVCASCGKAAVDNIKLKNCTACKLVKYCGVECQKNHRPQHKKACKKRAAEIRDDKLFRQPDEIHLGECPLCFLPLSLDMEKSTMHSCCSKVVCNGCEFANKRREWEESLERRCPFCREPSPKTQKENDQYKKKRIKANDPAALRAMGTEIYHKGDYEGAFKYYTKAAALGDMEAHYNLSALYRKGEGVEKDNKKRVYHLEVAAIGGHPEARYDLGNHEGRTIRFDRALKHHIIAAKLGLDEALERVKECFAEGIASKEDYEAALRGHQAAVDATKSEQRDAAEKYLERK